MLWHPYFCSVSAPASTKCRQTQFQIAVDAPGRLDSRMFPRGSNRSRSTLVYPNSIPECSRVALPTDTKSVFNADKHKTTTNVAPSRSRCSRSARFKPVPTWFCSLESMYDNQECSHALLFLQFCVIIALVDNHLTVGGQTTEAWKLYRSRQKYPNEAIRK